MGEIDPNTAWWVGTIVSIVAAVAAIVSACFARYYQREANTIATKAGRANAALEALARLPGELELEILLSASLFVGFHSELDRIARELDGPTFSGKHRLPVLKSALVALNGLKNAVPETELSEYRSKLDKAEKVKLDATTEFLEEIREPLLTAWRSDKVAAIYTNYETQCEKLVKVVDAEPTFDGLQSRRLEAARDVATLKAERTARILLSITRTSDRGEQAHVFHDLIATR